VAEDLVFKVDVVLITMGTGVFQDLHPDHGGTDHPIRDHPIRDHMAHGTMITIMIIVTFEGVAAVAVTVEQTISVRIVVEPVTTEVFVMAEIIIFTGVEGEVAGITIAAVAVEEGVDIRTIGITAIQSVNIIILDLLAMKGVRGIVIKILPLSLYKYILYSF